MNEELLPASQRKDAYTRIKKFMTDGDITLLPKEEHILSRWCMADKLMKLNKYTEEQIVEKIVEKFSVSQYTARKDIYNAQALMASVMLVNKKYLLNHHAENLKLMIEQFKKDKTLVHLVPKLAAEYTRAIQAIPDDLNAEKRPAPTIIFNVTQSAGKTFEEALASIEKRKADKEFTDFEEVVE